MSLEHSHALSEIRPDVMKTPDHHTAVLAALRKHAVACAGFDFHFDHDNLAQATPYHRQIIVALNELRALGGVLNAKGQIEVTLKEEENDTLNALYSAAHAHLQATYFQGQEAAA